MVAGERKMKIFIPERHAKDGLHNKGETNG